MRSYLLFAAWLLPITLGFPHLGNHNVESLARFPKPKGMPGMTNSTLLPNHFTWRAPDEDDLRSPCPTLNTLSNHGFLPHHGRKLTLDVLIKGLKDGINIGEGIAMKGFQRALPANPIPNATWLDLGMLHRHGVIEHDGSLSRRDAVFDPTNRFDESTFENFLSYFGDATDLNISTTANARARHALDMSRINPEFAIPEDALPNILGENAMMLAIWGSADEPIANRAYFEYFFRNERLPVELDWAPGKVEISGTIQQIVTDLLDQSPPDVALTFGQ